MVPDDESALWKLFERAEIVLLIIFSLGGLSLELLNWAGVISFSPGAILFCTIAALIAFGILLVLRQIGETNQLILRTFCTPEAVLIEGHDEFYRKAEEEVRKATKTIKVTHFYPYPPSADARTADSLYFKAMTEAITTKKDLEVFRVVSIDNPEKFQWVDRTIGMFRDNSNFHLKYNPHVHDKFPIMNLLIFDDRKVFLGIYRQRGVSEKAVFIDNKDLTLAFLDYFAFIETRSEDLKTGDYVNTRLVEDLRARFGSHA